MLCPGATFYLGGNGILCVDHLRQLLFCPLISLLRNIPFYFYHNKKYPQI